MEAFSPCVGVLDKFSNAIWVLSYYAYFYKAEYLMNTLCLRTRNCWIQNVKAFRDALPTGKKVLRYLKFFDNQISWGGRELVIE
jgi:hypothetical protein